MDRSTEIIFQNVTRIIRNFGRKAMNWSGS